MRGNCPAPGKRTRRQPGTYGAANGIGRPKRPTRAWPAVSNSRAEMNIEVVAKEPHPAHFAAVAGGPKTIVHGDYRGDNVLFGGGSRDDLAVIDWQGCGIGCGMYDVAFFLGTSVTVDDRRRIERDVVDEYHDVVCRMGAKNYTRDDCWRSYRQNLLGTLMPMVIGCGALDMSERKLVNQTRELLRRTLTAIEDLDSGEFLPARERLLSPGGAFSILSRCGYQAYRFLLGLRKRKAD